MEVPLGDTYYIKFTTRSFSTGAPTQLAGTPVVSVYEEANLTQITSGVTLTADYDSVTGLNDIAIVASGANGYEVGKYYSAVITTGTVGGVSVVGEVVGHFRIVPAEDAGAGIRDVNLTHIGDAAQSATDLKDFADDGYDPATNKVQGVVLVDTCTTNTDMRGTDSAATAAELAKVPKSDGTTSWNATALAAINAEADTAISDASLATAAELAKVPKSDGTSSWNATALAAIQSEANDAIVANGLDHLVGAAVAGTDVTDNSIIAKMVASGATADWDTFVNTTDSLQAVRDHIGDGTNLTEAGGDGDHLTAINLPDQTMNITGNITGNLSGTIGSLGATAKSDVNAEVVDALNTDTYAEPAQGTPPATTTLQGKISYLYKAWRNRSTQTATTYSLYNDDATTVDHKATVSDNGTTADKGEVTTGP